MEDHFVSATHAIQSINRVELGWLLWVIHGLEPDKSASPGSWTPEERCTCPRGRGEHGGSSARFKAETVKLVRESGKTVGQV